MREQIRLCLIEDDEFMGDALMERFQSEDFDCIWCKSGKEALANLQRRRFDVVLSDIFLPDLGGGDLFAQLQKSPDSMPPFVFMTAYGAIDQAVDLLKLGAADYVTKPLDVDDVVLRLRELAGWRDEAADCTLGVSDAMRHIEQILLPRLAGSSSGVLITGESGTGKEHVALRLHELASAGATRPFVAVNCAAVPETLMEAEMFGYQKGAFTGAGKERRGVFEQADGGTLFLDEVGDMPLVMQAKLLRAIQDGAVTRIGGEARIPVNVRIVCATHHDLTALVAERRFREDLYYRINLFHLHIPPLRERRSDILWLARRFRNHHAHRAGHYAFTAAAERALLSCDWPGNVRELKHCIERACVLARNPRLTPEALFGETTQSIAAAVGGEPLFTHLASCERRYIEGTLAQHGWHLGKAARALGISRKNLWEKIRKHGISEPGKPVGAG